MKPACQATLRFEGGKWYRLIEAAHLSRPEDYFSIYRSGCNHTCLKCHSWYFTQRASGTWMSADDIVKMAAKYAEIVTVREPRWRATMWHATDLRRHCGMCPVGREASALPERPEARPSDLEPAGGWGPARNIIAFTGATWHAEPSSTLERPRR